MTSLEFETVVSPGGFAVRFSFWQELVALATSTYIDPCGSMAKGCMGWSPVSGIPETITSGLPVGTIDPSDRA